jgi:hypothetical protein
MGSDTLSVTNFSVIESVQTGAAADPASHFINIEDSSSGSKALRRKADLPAPHNDKLKYKWS